MRRLICLAVVLLAVSARAATDDDLAKVLQNLATMVDVGYEIQRYSIGHLTLPAAKSPVELARTVMGHDSAASYLVDPWGTPYWIESDPARQTYTIVSAGSDKKFERTTWSRPGNTNDSAADTVFRNGAFVRSAREWALGEYAKQNHDDPAVLKRVLENSKAMGTFVNVRVIAMAMDDYAREHGGQYPRGTPEEILKTLDRPKGERTDNWETPLRITVSDDGKHYRIVSAGADLTFDKDVPSKPENTTDFKKDLILVDGEWLRGWNRDPLDAVEDARTTLLVNEMRYASLATMPAEERLALRRKALETEMVALWQKDDVVGAMRKYEALEDLVPRYVNLEFLINAAYPYSSRLLPPPPPPPPGKKVPETKPEHVLTASEKAEAKERIAAALRRAIALNPDEHSAVERLAWLEVLSGRVAEGEAVITQYEKRPQNRGPAATLRFEIDKHLGRNPDPERLARIDAKNPEAWYVVGVTMYERLAKPAHELTAAEKQSLIRRGIEALDRAVELKPDYFEAFVYENLLYRQAAINEPDPEKARALVEKADALRNRAIAITRERKAKRQ